MKSSPPPWTEPEPAFPSSKSLWRSGAWRSSDAQVTFCGEWVLGREIGRGAYGVVHFATRRDGACAAVKVCRRDALDAGSYGRELRGAKLYAAIPPCEGLVRTRAVVEEEWGFYAVMDLADDDCGGGDPSAYVPKTLARAIEGSKALPLGECVALGAALSTGLATLQRRLLLHRDIKPENVLYVNGRPVLSDPGLVIEESNAASIVGTPGYVPPERFVSAGSDVYSLGLTLMAASFGRRIGDLDKGPATEADTSDPHFPAWWRILNKATEKSPARRYQSAKALLKDLSALERRMKISSAAHSRAAKVLGVSVLVLVASVCVFLAMRGFGGRIASQQKELDSVNASRSAEADRRERMIRDAKWDVFGMDIMPDDDSVLEMLIGLHSRKDAEKAVGLRALMEKRKELRKSLRAIRKEIKTLRSEAKRKVSSGLDDGAEFAKAEALHKKCSAMEKEISAIGKEISSGSAK